MRLAFPVLASLALLAAPSTAHANAGIGFLSVAIPFTAVALVPAIIVEAPILARWLGVSFGRGLLLAFAANLFSTVAGAILAMLGDFAILGSLGLSGASMSTAAVLVSLVPMFFVTWWLEAAAVRRMQGSRTADVAKPARKATFVANAVSYGLLALAIPWVQGTSLDYPRSEARWRLSEIHALFLAERETLTAHYDAHKRFPAPRPIAVKSKYAKSMRLEADGRLVVVIHYPGTEALDGKEVVQQPRLAAGIVAGWDCYAPRESHKFMPPACRNPPGAGTAAPSPGSPS